MKKSLQLSLLAVALLIFLAPAAIHAAPAPWGIAFNTETGECAGYWAGDEFTAYPLPEGWTDFYPDFDEGDAVINTSEGFCTFESEESCCEELGFEYISDNIGAYDPDDYDETGDPLINSNDPALYFFCGCLCCFVVGLAVVIIAIIAMTSKNKPPIK